MRIQMRLSNEAEIILQKEKERMKNEEDITVTYGWIVNTVTKKIYEKYEEIDWIKIKNTTLKLVDVNNANNCEYITTLNLEQSVLKRIEDLQIYLKKIFNASRIHKAFVVRMILKANYLYQNSLID